MGISTSVNLPIRVARPKRPPDGIANLGNVEFATIAADNADAIGQLADLAYPRTDKFILTLVENGAIVVTQRGRRCRVEAGQYALFDCSNGLEVAGIDDCRLLAIFVPNFLLRARLRNIPMIVAQPYASTGSPWRIASNLVRLLASEIKHIPIPLAYGYANQVVELLTVAIEADWNLSAEFSGRSALLKRCAAYVKSNVADCSLDPQKIATAMRISVRYLHKVFEESGESVCEFLRSTRLETSKLELADPQKASLQIREIAHRVGFRSQAHFAAAFKGRYGISATEWRRTATREAASKAEPPHISVPFRADNSSASATLALA